MQFSSTTSLEKKAIDAALKSNWNDAIQFNIQILEKDPKSLDAKLRLGRAYLQISEFNKAKKIFKEVLEQDPINQTAQKNYKLASEKRNEKKNLNTVNSSSLIVEPGTSQEIRMEIIAKRVFAEDFTPGEEFKIKVEKNVANIFKVKPNGEELLLGSINSEIVRKLQSAKAQGAKIESYFSSGKEKEMEVILKTSIPVFRSEKQDVKPYIKKESIDEPELEIPEMEE